MGSAFGLAGEPIEIRKDLPNRVKSFVIDHEKYHLKDTSKNWLWREVKANMVSGFKHPIGFLQTAWMSLTNKERLKFYQDRFKNKY